MEKALAHGSYWLGVVCSLVALVWKGLQFLNVMPEALGDLKYMTLFKGALLLLLVSIATTGCASLKSQKT